MTSPFKILLSNSELSFFFVLVISASYQNIKQSVLQTAFEYSRSATALSYYDL